MKRRLFFIVALASALCACTKEIDIAQEAPTRVFTATTEPETKATFDNTAKCASWEAGDRISINGKIYSAQEAGTTTSFKAVAEDQQAEGPDYKAYFPASLYDGTTATLPATVSETWSEGKFDVPMYATSTTTKLEFKNLCGVLKISVGSGQIAAVKRIRVSSANKAVSGAFSVADNAAMLADPSAVANTLTVTYTDAVATDAAGKVFYVAVPAQTYQDLRIELSADGESFTKSMTTKSATAISVARNKIYPIAFADNAPAKKGTATRKDDVEVNWVQLWENGPKFAEYNIGAASNKAEDYGCYYAWGGNQDKVDDHRNGPTALTGLDDTATKLWGGNWRMPTDAEFAALLENCDAEWTESYEGSGIAGRIFTGRGAYAGGSIFLPAGGYYRGYISGDGTDGYYWTSTPLESGEDMSHFLGFHSKNQYKDFNDRAGYCYSIRAVLSEFPEAIGTATRKGDVEVDWVQLWENGPKFAEYNVGAANNKAEDYGGKYAWGGNQDTVDDHRFGPTPLTGLDDTATKLWGGYWRMASDAEFAALLENCDVTWTDNYRSGQKGMIFTGKGDYAHSSVFIPAAGYFSHGSLSGAEEYGYYWSSTPTDSDEDMSRFLLFRSGNQEVDFNDRASYCYSIRAVLSEFPGTTGTATRKGGVAVDWVQLWENGPKFAEYNVGAASNKAEDYGCYYAWGGNQDKVDDHYTGVGNLPVEYDTATNLWGENWRMPTAEELRALIAKCDIIWTDKYKDGRKGIIFTGKDNYAHNSVFLSAGGWYYDVGIFNLDKFCTYWTSSYFANGGPNDWVALYLSAYIPEREMIKVINNKRSYGRAVRPVLAE